jgi:DNA-binding transcriptional LysR family regulator
MDWRRIDFDWNQARAFLATAETGSFAAAARALKLAQPTFDRGAHGATLTEAGLELLEPLRAMAEAASDVALTASGAAGRLEGVVRVTASELIAAFLLPPVLARLRRAQPGITIEVVATQELRDLRRREADLAIRNTPPTDPELVARRLPDAEGGLYASPDYLARLGPLLAPADLARAAFIAFDATPALASYLRQMGLPVADDRFPLVSGSHLVQWEMCRAGLGIAVGLEEVARGDPRLARVPVALPPLPVQMWLVSHRALRTSRRLRVVADALVSAFGGDLQPASAM